MTGALYLGVDGGATRCRARLRDANGQALAEASGAAANIHVDFAGAVAALRAVVDELLAKAGLQDADRGLIAIGLGLAGFKEESDAAGVAAAFPGFRLAARGERRDRRLHRRPRRRGRRADHRWHRLCRDRPGAGQGNDHRRAWIRARRRRLRLPYRPRRAARRHAISRRPRSGERADRTTSSAISTAILWR